MDAVELLGEAEYPIQLPPHVSATGRSLPGDENMYGDRGPVVYRQHPAGLSDLPALPLNLRSQRQGRLWGQSRLFHRHRCLQLGH